MAFQTNRIEVDGSINIDGSIFQYGVELTGGGGGGGTGDVAWASGNVGSNNYMITAAGDGSIVAESDITFATGTLQFSTGQATTIRLAASSGGTYPLNIGGQYTSGVGNTAGDVSIYGGQADSGGNGGAVNISGGYSTGGSGGDVNISGGTASGSAGGDIKIITGSGSGSGGSITIKAVGPSTSGGDGGDVSINAGPGGSTGGQPGSIFLGVSDTSALFIGTTSNISTGTPGTNQILYVDTADGNKLKRGSVTADISTLSIESYVDSSSYYDASLMYRVYPDPSTLTNYTSQGIYVRLTSQDTIYARQAVGVNTSGRIRRCYADSSSNMPAIGINPTNTTWSSGNTYDVLIHGVYYHSTNSFTTGKPVYISTAGYLTSTAPANAGNCVQVIGIAISPDSMIVNPSPDFVVIG